jgi:1-acyl-sn-glycerol-3-phosphate acyltransferase
MQSTEKQRDFFRYLYSPWTWLVFIPYLAASTIFFGILAVGLGLLSRRASFHCGTLWAWLLCRVNWTWVSVRGRAHAQKDQSYIIMSNHQSHFDVLAIYGHWGRQFRWVMKQELRKVPGLGWGCESVGHIFIDRSDRQKAIASMNASRHLLKGGVSIMIFPEGTRSPDGRMGPLKKGGFMMALELGLPILPLSISGSHHILSGKSFRLLPGVVRIQIHKPINVSAYDPGKRDQLIQDVTQVIASGLNPQEQRRGQV